MKLYNEYFVALIIFVYVILVGWAVCPAISNEVCLVDRENEYNECLMDLVEGFDACGGENINACVDEAKEKLKECLGEAQEDSKECIDSDNDNVSDLVDRCHNSDLESTVVIDNCDSGVTNHLLDDGCTIKDIIDTCAIGANNHGNFVSCVADVTNDLQKDGVITGREKGAIQRCAAQADIP